MKRLISDNEELLQVLEDNGIDTTVNADMEIIISDEDAERIPEIVKEHAPAATDDYGIEDYAYTYYEVMVRFEGSDGWESICKCRTRAEANEEIDYQKTIGADVDCEYTVMERHTNNPNGRPTKGEEPRKACTYRLQPSTAEMVRKAAEEKGCSQSDLIEDIVRDALG